MEECENTERQDKNEAMKAQHEVEFIYCALIELLKIHTDFHTTLHTNLHGNIVSIFLLMIASIVVKK